MMYIADAVPIRLRVTARLKGEVTMSLLNLLENFDTPVLRAALAPPLPGPVDVAVLRRRLKLTQDGFAHRYGIPLPTLRQWEQGLRKPDATVRAYLTVIARDPEGVAAAFAGAANANLAELAMRELGALLDAPERREGTAALSSDRRSPARSPARAASRRASPAAPAASRNPGR